MSGLDISKKFKTDLFHTVLYTVIALCGLASIPLFSDKAYNFIFKNRWSRSSADYAKIVHLENEVFYRNIDSQSWESAKKLKYAREGDSLLTGDASQLSLSCKDGLDIVMHESSIIHLVHLGQGTISDFQEGHFSLILNDRLYFAINGKYNEVIGKNAHIEVFVKRNESPKIYKTQGEAQVITEDGKEIPIPVEANFTQSKLAQSKAFEFPNSAQKNIPPPPLLVTSTQAKPLIHIDEFADFYENTKDGIRFVPEKRSQFNQAWSSSFTFQGDAPKKIYAQLAPTEEFTSELMTATTSGEQSQITFNQFQLGHYFIRYSADEINWGPSQELIFKNQPLSTEGPTLHLINKTTSSNKIPILNETIDIKIQASSSASIPDLEATLVEVSSNGDFNPAYTNIILTKKNLAQWTMGDSSLLYVRARSINKYQQITSYGPTIILDVVKPEWPEPPKISTQKIEMLDKEKKLLTWQGQTQKYKITIQNQNGEIIKNALIPATKFELGSLIPGTYGVSIQGVDSYGRDSKRQTYTEVIVKKIEASPSSPSVQK